MRRVIVAAVTAMVVYATVWIGYVLNWAWLDAIDTAWLGVLHDFGATRPGWISFWVGVSVVFAPRVIEVIGLVVIIIGMVRERYRIALFLFISVILMSPVLTGAKWLVARPRPATAFVYESSTSFPSGHAFCVMVGVLSLGTVLWPAIQQRWRLGLALLGAAVILIVGSARVVLNVHHPSDVLAGWALGFLYYLLCARLVSPRRTADVSALELD